MITYSLRYSKRAIEDLGKLAKNDPKAYVKAGKLIDELKTHPFTGTGHPHQLTADRTGQWARRITHKHRLVYRVIDDTVVIEILTAYGHYDDK
ncbi:MAG: Txe/YoeB family addiction module toxin [Bacteroidales bacterium]|nr:Txe/YoeB family addiction module toxin [Candidatus Equimonas enterica]